jgi:AGZA family xanthine/uracil permease-like MFS transporter
MATSSHPPGGFLERHFKITERGSTVRTEVIAGIVTFATMAYILFVNPSVLGALQDSAGVQLQFPALLTVTALAAAIGTVAMGIFANVPFAIAAGLGLNAFVAFGLVGARGLTWAEAMGVIVVEGLIIAILVIVGLREKIMLAFPDGLRRGIGAGIGAFIAIIGLHDARIVLSAPEGDSRVSIITGELVSWHTLVFAVGLTIGAVLIARGIRGALLISIIASTILAVIINQASDGKEWSNGVADIPSKWVGTPDFSLVGAFNFDFVNVLGFGTALAIVVAVMLSDFFDTMGSAVALGRRAHLVDETTGSMPNLRRILLIDGLAASLGGATSSSSNTTYIESASGIGEGGRTGLTSVVTGVLFALAMFLSPIAGVIPAEATAPALVIVGALMLSQVVGIEWDDIGIALPALLTILVMPATYSITNGVGFGIISYVVIAVLRGKPWSVHPLLYGCAALFTWYFIYGAI